MVGQLRAERPMTDRQPLIWSGSDSVPPSRYPISALREPWTGLWIACGFACGSLVDYSVVSVVSAVSVGAGDRSPVALS